MSRNIVFFAALATTLVAFACGCTKPSGDKVEEPLLPVPPAERCEMFRVASVEDVPYRIPALGKTNEGRLIAVADYRFSKADIGVANNGRIDLHYRLSDDNGHSWSEVHTLVEGKGAEAEDFLSVGYGDPCIVADSESSRVLVMSCAGNVSFQQGTRDRHQGIARFYSEDGGQSWSEPEDIAESIYEQFDDSVYGPVRSMFVASGRIMQSKTTKVGSHYRLYCAVLIRDRDAKHMNYVLYSDDFGLSWRVLGDIDTPAVYGTADEAKVEELPNGTLLISSRTEGGRYYNIFTFSDIASASGSWGEAHLSNVKNGGVAAAQNSTNGEVAIIPVVRNADGEAMHLLLQSLPFGPQRKRVGIYYKALASEEEYLSSEQVATDWDGSMLVSTINSAYSTMIWQEDNNLGFLFEEETHGISSSQYGGYNIVYDAFSVEEITDGEYSYRR